MADDKDLVPTRQPPLDRGAVERVLARAAELQGAESGDDASDLITESQIVEIGKEVGLAPATIRQALAEERTRIHTPEERGRLAQIAGSAFASATRTVSGTPSGALARIDQWMQRRECLIVQRRFADRITWEPQRGIVGLVRRGLNVSGRGYTLSRASQVSATVVPIDGNRIVVRLDADLSLTRRRRLETAGAVSGIGLFGSAGLGFALTIAAVPFAIAAAVGAVPLLAGGVAGYYIVGAHRSLVNSAQLALEQILDRLEQRDLPDNGSLLSAFTTGRLLRR